ncbi:hypothetical protein IOD16_14095 [Saccharothrix sp. 6-C]|uniref:hypothetical protein n=1 Tax=Saccharothrix sp. 6-C TaxID=2781735 RepID=UPI001916E6A5|nr:hypothetical protein [Saccharothrix sp. 6-C]QQQ79431.1 hypothetical protein IOD16_14095 [Saccharothrix sp. 6-C]
MATSTNTRKDDKALGNQVEVVIYRRSDPDGTTRQVALEPDVKSAFTTSDRAQRSHRPAVRDRSGHHRRHTLDRRGPELHLTAQSTALGVARRLECTHRTK